MSVARLAEAVSKFEEELKRAQEEAVYLSNELLKENEKIIESVRREVEEALSRITARAREEVARQSEALRAEYSKRAEEELSRLEIRAKANMERAAERVAEELRRLLGEL
ncbi:MAG: hypothetical protein N3F67_00210 [Acidilobaceae archaeon]|nr:hypothetical protein [Acidilobaceae archaeon]